MILYLDTSSLVKLYVTEAGSEEVHALVARASLVATSRIAYPETRAALARRRRDDTLRARDFTAAKRALESDWPSYLVVDVTAAICQEAGDIAERYRLRGFDSVHLASFAEVVRGGGGASSVFSSYHTQLNRFLRKRS